MSKIKHNKEINIAVGAQYLSTLFDSDFIIPKFQRMYSWTNTQVEDMWKDLFYSGDETEGHFFGQIILSAEKDGRYSIIDGQQRFVSFVLLNAALCNFTKNNFDREDKNFGSKVYDESRRLINDITSRYLVRSNPISNSDRELKLYPDAYIKSFLYGHIVKGSELILESKNYKQFLDERRKYKGKSKLYDSLNDADLRRTINGDLKNIFSNYFKFYNLIENYVSDHQLSAKGYAKKLLDKLAKISEQINKSKLIFVLIEDIKYGQELFELMNTRGKVIDSYDKLKNYFYIRAELSEDESTVDRLYEGMTKNLRTIQNKSNKCKPKVLIRHHYLSSVGFTSDSKLYSAYKNFLEDKKLNIIPLNELKNIHESFELYSYFYNDIHDFSPLEDYLKHVTRDQARKLHNSIFSLTRGSDSIQSNVFLLSALKRLKNETTSECKKIIISSINYLPHFVFAYLNVMRGRQNKVEHLYSKYSIRLNKIELHNTEKYIKWYLELITELMKLYAEYDNKSNFVETIENMSYKNTRTVFIQQLIRNYYTKNINTSSMNIDTLTVDIDHVFAQNPVLYNLKKNQVKHFVHRLGNLILLDSNKNKEMKHKTILQKIEELATSDIPSTKDYVSRISQLTDAQKTSVEFGEFVDAENKRIGEEVYNNVKKYLEKDYKYLELSSKK